MNEHACSDIQSAAAEIIADSFSHPDGEQTMKMERREVGDTCELGNLERVAQMCINMVKYPIQPPCVFVAAASNLPLLCRHYCLVSRIGGVGSNKCAQRQSPRRFVEPAPGFGPVHISAIYLCKGMKFNAIERSITCFPVVVNWKFVWKFDRSVRNTRVSSDPLTHLSAFQPHSQAAIKGAWLEYFSLRKQNNRGQATVSKRISRGLRYMRLLSIQFVSPAPV